MTLETEIAKAQTRQRVYASLEEDHGNLESKDDTVSDVKQNQPKFMSSTPAAPLNPVASQFHLNILVSKSSPQANSSTTGTSQGTVLSSDIKSQPEPYEKSFEEVMAMQRQQNKQMIATDQQLAAAMTLPQPEVHKFDENPIKYGTFIIAFKMRIEYRTLNAADCLYYLEQHLEGEPENLSVVVYIWILRKGIRKQDGCLRRSIGIRLRFQWPM